jgi:ribosomal protein S27AE
MAYHKVVPVARPCAFCGTEFLAAHRRRIYCSNSCNTRMCLARKGRAAGAPPAAGLASAASEPVKVTLASNVQNWAMLAFVPQVLGEVVQVLCNLFTPRRAGPSTWLSAALQQLKGPLATLQHAEWEEPRFFVKISYASHTLYYRAQHELLVVREPDGSLRQLSTAAEFAALTAAPGGALAAISARYASRFTPPAQAPLLPSDLPLEQEVE